MLIVHNSYQYHGGEESVVDNEVQLLESNGHVALKYFVSNDQINNNYARIKAAFSAIYNVSQYRKLLKILRREKPDVVHIHNFFPLISPSVIYACRKAGVASVATIHNYRILCPSTALYHNGDLYYEGINGRYLRVLRDKPYNNSYIGTLCLIIMSVLHRRLQTWRRLSKIVVMSKFQKALLEQRIAGDYVEIPHFTASQDIAETSVTNKGEEYFVYVGRLSQEKGIMNLLKIWPRHKTLLVIGDGPLEETCTEVSATNKSIKMLGKKPKSECLSLMRNAIATVFPSVTHETFGLVNIESYSVATPVIANDISPSNELVKHGETGALFDVQQQSSLLAAIALVEENRSAMVHNCGKIFQQTYSETSAIEKLEQCFDSAIRKQATL